MCSPDLSAKMELNRRIESLSSDHLPLISTIHDENYIVTFSNMQKTNYNKLSTAIAAIEPEQILRYPTYRISKRN